LGGDISSSAIDIAKRLLDILKPTLEEQGIEVYAEWKHWNALDADQTTELLHHWITSSTVSSLHFLILANFSGFLHKEKKFDQANPQLQEMFRWMSMRPSSAALWVEPPSNKSTEFFRNLSKRVVRGLKRIRLWRSESNVDQPQATTICKMAHAFEPNSHFRTGVHLILLQQTPPII
jgi:hypothetical protein